MKNNPQWLQWAVELQSLAQTGLAYCKDVYDGERYQRIRDISAEMVSHMSEVPLDKVKDLFCCEGGYQTPKIDTRAAIFFEDKILLVRENDGLWSLPGGWCDVNVSIAENTVKEAKEEAGLDVAATRLIAVLDSAKHNTTLCPYGICKFFVLCTAHGGSFVPNSETTESGYFSLDALPPLSVMKNNEQQIKMCFEAYRSPQWVTIFD
ncbi:MAG: NUDIX hydrolase [Clostridia bacterium]|nr:NUDIX hydrolase [Clostridia bacterium]